MFSMEDTNKDFELAYRIVEHTGTHLFLTGRAGTGKTTFLRSLTARSSKRIVVAAPTGIAAINAGGVTLHSLFQLDFGLFMPGKKRKPLRFSREKLRLLKLMDVLVIDEISMVRADLLDAVDDMLRRLRNPYQPFGGVQLVMIGDLLQLPPVVTEEEKPFLQEQYATPYFFSSRALALTDYVTIELQKVYRQENKDFLAILAEVRGGRPSQAVIGALNRCFVPHFELPEDEHWIRLTSHNATASSVNADKLKALSAEPYTYHAVITGNFPKGVCPADETLVLKAGAQVMFIKNDPSPEKKFFNGMLGTVTDLDEDSVTVMPENGDYPITVGALSWENRKYEVDANTGELHEIVDGLFNQIPLRLAWAITIHKSQGLTFEHAIVDASSCFAHGQAYVALSRLRSLKGLVLSAPIPAYSIISDPTVNGFMSVQGDRRPDEGNMHALESSYALTMLDSLYDFTPDISTIEDIHKLVADAYHATYPSVVREYGERQERFKDEIVRPATTFKTQYARIIQTPDSLPMLTERLAASAGYFPSRIEDFMNFIAAMPEHIDNAEVKKRLKNKLAELADTLALKSHLIASLADTPFSTASLLDTKRQYLLQVEKGSARNVRKEKKSKDSDPDELENPEIFKALVEWRKEVAKKQGIPAFRVLSTRALIQIANRRPAGRKEFLAVPGCGPRTTALYYEDIQNILAEFEEI